MTTTIIIVITKAMIMTPEYIISVSTVVLCRCSSDSHPLVSSYARLSLQPTLSSAPVAVPALPMGPAGVGRRVQPSGQRITPERVVEVGVRI